MAIAIPSVTKYITESRKKTVVSTIGNYITAMVNEVNDLTYTFTGDNTIYAVPIECIALERGGTNPFGAWHQANDAYWAYVLVQYDDETSSYRYGYTFKDSAGYGLYPTTQAKLNEGGKQIQTGLDLNRPKTGKVTVITAVDNWSGFSVDSSTDLVVLKSEVEGNVGDGINTCTLQQKGDNYEQVKNDKDTEEDLVINTPLYYGKSYISKPAVSEYLSAFMSVVFYEDGSAKTYVNDVLDQELPVGSIKYNNKQMSFYDGNSTITLNISDDKKNLSDESGTMSLTLLDELESEKLALLIKQQNTIKTNKPVLTTINSDKGLYSSMQTNSGKTTYYFRGNVTNNYVAFAGLTWRIVRINEDGTIRLILNGRISSTNSKFSKEHSSYTNMYYSNSETLRVNVNNWYDANLKGTKFETNIVTGQFCEQARVKELSSYTSGNVEMNVYTSYTPDFKCTTDGNGKGIINSKVGLITYDEVIYAGGYPTLANRNYYLYNGNESATSMWTMTPAAGVGWENLPCAWVVGSDGTIYTDSVYYDGSVRPVINLKSDVLATGSGTTSDPYFIITN